jgi:hypothetical protein
MIDFHTPEAEKSIESMLATDWERLIPGHPGAPSCETYQKRSGSPRVKASVGHRREGSDAAQVRILTGL